MNNSIKGAFWSGLIFPGMGQIVLKHYVRGTIIILVVSISMIIIIAEAVEQALTTLEKLRLEGSAISMSVITRVVTEIATIFQNPTHQYLILMILSFWVISNIDAYLIGRKKERE